MIPNDNLINLIHYDKFNVPLYSNYQKFRALTRSDVNQIEWSYEYDMLLLNSTMKSLIKLAFKEN